MRILPILLPTMSLAAVVFWCGKLSRDITQLQTIQEASKSPTRHIPDEVQDHRRARPSTLLTADGKLDWQALEKELPFGQERSFKITNSSLRWGTMATILEMRPAALDEAITELQQETLPPEFRDHMLGQLYGVLVTKDPMRVLAQPASNFGYRLNDYRKEALRVLARTEPEAALAWHKKEIPREQSNEQHTLDLGAKLLSGLLETIPELATEWLKKKSLEEQAALLSNNNQWTLHRNNAKAYAEMIRELLPKNESSQKLGTAFSHPFFFDRESCIELMGLIEATSLDRKEILSRSSQSLQSNEIMDYVERTAEFQSWVRKVAPEHEIEIITQSLTSYQGWGLAEESIFEVLQHLDNEEITTSWAAQVKDGLSDERWNNLLLKIKDPDFKNTLSKGLFNNPPNK